MYSALIVHVLVAVANIEITPPSVIRFNGLKQPSGNPAFVAASADGAYFATFAADEHIYVRTGDGRTWTAPIDIGLGSGPAIASTTDGFAVAWLTQDGVVLQSLDASGFAQESPLQLANSGASAVKLAHYGDTLAIFIISNDGTSVRVALRVGAFAPSAFTEVAANTGIVDLEVTSASTHAVAAWRSSGTDFNYAIVDTAISHLGTLPAVFGGDDENGLTSASDGDTALFAFTRRSAFPFSGGIVRVAPDGAAQQVMTFAYEAASIGYDAGGFFITYVDDFPVARVRMARLASNYNFLEAATDIIIETKTDAQLPCRAASSGDTAVLVFNGAPASTYAFITRELGLRGQGVMSFEAIAPKVLVPEGEVRDCLVLVTETGATTWVRTPPAGIDGEAEEIRTVNGGDYRAAVNLEGHTYAAGGHITDGLAVNYCTPFAKCHVAALADDASLDRIDDAPQEQVSVVRTALVGNRALIVGHVGRALQTSSLAYSTYWLSGGLERGPFLEWAAPKGVGIEGEEVVIRTNDTLERFDYGAEQISITDLPFIVGVDKQPTDPILIDNRAIVAYVDGWALKWWEVDFAGQAHERGSTDLAGVPTTAPLVVKGAKGVYVAWAVPGAPARLISVDPNTFETEYEVGLGSDIVTILALRRVRGSLYRIYARSLSNDLIQSEFTGPGETEHVERGCANVFAPVEVFPLLLIAALKPRRFYQRR